MSGRFLVIGVEEIEGRLGLEQVDGHERVLDLPFTFGPAEPHTDDGLGVGRLSHRYLIPLR